MSRVRGLWISQHVTPRSAKPSDDDDRGMVVDRRETDGGPHCLRGENQGTKRWLSISIYYYGCPPARRRIHRVGFKMKAVARSANEVAGPASPKNAMHLSAPIRNHACGLFGWGSS